LVNHQRDAQFLSMYLSLFLTLYMFRAHSAHHQERQIVSIQPLVAAVSCAGREWTPDLHTRRPPKQSDSYQRLYWHNLSLLMWVRCARNMHRV